jgi:hypothetical protein
MRRTMLSSISIAILLNVLVIPWAIAAELTKIRPTVQIKAFGLAGAERRTVIHDGCPKNLTAEVELQQIQRPFQEFHLDVQLRDDDAWFHGKDDILDRKNVLVQAIEFPTVFAKFEIKCQKCKVQGPLGSSGEGGEGNAADIRAWIKGINGDAKTEEIKVFCDRCGQSAPCPYP